VSRLDRMFADARAAALRKPVVRANQESLPKIELPGGVALALSVNR